ncbi:glycosyltransferase family 4 protein [Rubellimicrobium arenae]|uniref:glycosyltransferase family 4 protein n=1 Tax=Rubellimicrobium arenae TaxID=2817372 RepID=UPI001B3158CC|nr:glycosyltransferase family 4 protein [Rubellimicrobium arenae]
MSFPQPIRILYVAPYVGIDSISEPRQAYDLIASVRSHVTGVILKRQDRHTRDLEAALPNFQVVEIKAERPRAFPQRLASVALPEYFIFERKAKGVIKRLMSEQPFDLVHQVTPMSIRYPSPARHFTVPYIIGPVNGSLKTPVALRVEMAKEPSYMNLRGLDEFRLRYSPALRRSFSRARLVIGGTSYIGETLKAVTRGRFTVLSEHGIERPDVLQGVARSFRHDTLNILFVGRLVRTKGARELVRAISLVQPHVKLVCRIVGSGPDFDDTCAEIEQLRLGDRVRMLGRLGPDQVREQYRSADVFIFPSFREASGGVLIEAMSSGLPIVTVDYGGPAELVDRGSAILVRPQESWGMAKEIAQAISALHDDRSQLERMSRSSLEHIRRNYLWSSKSMRLLDIYRTALS